MRVLIKPLTTDGTETRARAELGPNRALKKSFEVRPVLCLHFQGNGGLWVTQGWASGSCGAQEQTDVLVDRERERRLRQGKENERFRPYVYTDWKSRPFLTQLLPGRENQAAHQGPHFEESLRNLLSLAQNIDSGRHLGDRWVHGTHRCKAGARTGKMTCLRSHS